MDKENVSPCIADAIQGISRITICGRQIRIDGLDIIFKQVLELEPLDDEEAARHLMYKVREYNYIPANMDSEYEAVISGLYQKEKTRILKSRHG